MRAIRTSFTAVIAMALIAGSAVGVAAQDEEFEPFGVAGRVEVPEGGYALTFPDGWLPIRTTVTDAIGMVESHGISQEFAQRLEAQGTVGINLVGRNLSIGNESCQVFSAQTDGLPLDELVDQDVDATRAGLELMSEPVQTMHVWPVGDVAEVFYIVRTPDGSELILRTWTFSDGVTYHRLSCVGQIDLGVWLSIAETFEFLPAEETPHPIGVGSRVEMPQDGYAITFPDDWVISTEEEFFSIFAGADDGASCGVEVEASLGDEPEALAAEYAEFLVAFQGDSIADGPHSEILSLPAGDVIRLEFDIEREEQVFRTSRYMYDGGEMVVTLNCVASERPEDSWLAIAESFEFLAAE